MITSGGRSVDHGRDGTAYSVAGQGDVVSHGRTAVKPPGSPFTQRTVDVA